MKFKIIFAEINEIEVGKQNAGDKYVLAEIMEDSLFASQSHKHTFFVPQSVIPQWEKLISENKLPPYSAKYVIVNDLPAYKVKRDDGTVMNDVRNSMRILVRTDESTGEAIEDARNQALRIIAARMVLVEMSSEAFTAIENAPAGAAPVVGAMPKFDPITGAPIPA
jgi:hypothetical protein